MFATVMAVNGWFRSAKKSDLDRILSEMILSERQRKVLDMFYVRKLDIGFIADTLCVSKTVVNVELREIRRKICESIAQQHNQK